ncbi:hypothetical protein [Dyella mobilis]|uniref:Uncharacterized protein n=1 Tax=Dyella mobilis TaxID=1849582 RepID=A0ABS2KJQ3_9GAMM|nr:hypothetical protein [Dyella mobilis]MBM7131309.1 hypothetical protein [Dyella mobilis]GLQ98755.1 hypothetical protein GCM10007863_31750 [Dyella mobilis]
MPSQSNVTPTTVRAFARVTAMDVTQAVEEQNEKGLFLTVYTVRPEPELALMG